MVDVIRSSKIEPLPKTANFSLLYTHEGRETHIKNGHPQNQHRHDQPHGMIAGPIAHHTERGYHKSKEGTARIPQENCGRTVEAKIVGQKTQASANKRYGQIDHVTLVVLQRHQAKKCAHDGTGPSCQPIHSIEKIDRIGDADNPESREDPFADITPDGIGQEADCDPVVDQNGHSGQLNKEFPAGRQFLAIIEQANDKNERAGQRYSFQLQTEMEVSQDVSANAM